MDKIEVIKRDGGLEEFQPQKIARVTTAAGLTTEEARVLEDKLKQWVYDSKKNPISTKEIRDKVVEELQKVNKYAADLFVWYEKTKEK